MNRREQLMENYENALFALLMNQVAEEEGKRLQKENLRLKQDPQAAVPAATDRRSLRTIRRAFSKDERRHVVRVTGRVLNKVALAAMLAATLFITAYAMNPEVRVGTLNLLIESSNVASRLNLGAEEEIETTDNVMNSEKDLILGYTLPNVPDGFELCGQEVLEHGAWIEYRRGIDESIYIDVNNTNNTVIDSEVQEQADAEAIQVQDYDGLLVEKEERIHITWGDTEHRIVQNNFVPKCLIHIISGPSELKAINQCIIYPKR